MCHGNFLSLPAEQKQRLIDNGRELMDRSSPTELEGVLKALGKDAEDAAVVAIVFAVVAEAKHMPELRLKGRSDLVGNLHKNNFVIENVPRFWTAILLAEKLVKISPELDMFSVQDNLVLLDPPSTANGNTSRYARARYTGPLTPAFISYIRGEAGYPTESFAPDLFFRPAVTGEPFIWIKSTPQLRALLAILVNCGLTTAEVELLLKKAVDTTAADYGLPPSIDVRLYDSQFLNNKQNKKTRDLRVVGIENHGVGRIICPSNLYCSTLLRKISSVSVSIAQNMGLSTNRIDILRVSMDLSARRKRRRRKTALSGDGGGSEDEDDGHGNGRSTADNGSVEAGKSGNQRVDSSKFASDLQERLFRVGPLVIPRNTSSGSMLCLEYNPTEGVVPTPFTAWPACYELQEISPAAQDIRVAFPASYGLSEKVLSKVIRKRKTLGVVLHEDVYDNQPVYMLYHALRDLVHVAPTPPSPTLISAEAAIEMGGSAHDPDGSATEAAADHRGAGGGMLGDDAGAAEAADGQVSSNDGDAFGDETRAAEAADDPVSSDDGDTLGDDAHAQAANDTVSGDDGDAYGDGARSAEAAGDPVSSDDDDAHGDIARSAEAAEDPVSSDDGDALDGDACAADAAVSGDDDDALGDGARSAEAADDPVRGDDSDALGVDACAADAADDPVSSDDGDTFGDDDSISDDDSDAARSAEAADNPVSGDDGDVPGDIARSAEAADDPVSGDDGDALGEEACAADVADNPVSGDGGDAFGDDACAAKLVDDSVSGDDSDALGDDARSADAADDPVSGDDGDAPGDNAHSAEAADDSVSGDNGDTLGDDARTGAAADDPGGNVHMMETASNAGVGAERGMISARAAETAADPDSCDGNVHCANAREVAKVDDPDSGGDGDARSNDARTEKVAANRNGSADGGAYAAEAAGDPGGGVGGDEPGIEAHTKAATDPASDIYGDVRGGDGPAGPYDLNNLNRNHDSDAAVRGDSYTMIHKCSIVGSDSERLLSPSSDAAVSSSLVAMAAADGCSATAAAAVDSAVANGEVDGCDSDTMAGGTVIKAASSDSQAVSVNVSDVTWSAAAWCGSEAAPGPGRADSDEINSRMAKSHEMHIIDDAFAAIAIFQILLVGLYCLPLVLPDRVSIMKLFVHPSVMKLASWENLFIEPVHRWRAGRTCSFFLHYIKPFYDRFDLFHNWLMDWRLKGELSVSDPREFGSAASLSSEVRMATLEPTGALDVRDNFGSAYLSRLSLTVRKSSGTVVSLPLPEICSCRDVCAAAGALIPYHCLWYYGRRVTPSDEPFRSLLQPGVLLLELTTSLRGGVPRKRGVLSRGLRPVPDDAVTDSPVPDNADSDSDVVYDSDSDPDSDPDSEAVMCANDDLPISRLERRAAWGGKICIVGGRYRLAMSPSLRRYVECMEAVQRFKASGGLLPLRLRLGRPHRQLRFPTRPSLLHGAACGGDRWDCGDSSGSGCYGDSDRDGCGVGGDDGRIDGKGDRVRGEGGQGGHVSFASTVGPLCLALPGASLARLAGMQAQLLHSINNRASLVAALQPSAGVCGGGVDDDGGRMVGSRDRGRKTSDGGEGCMDGHVSFASTVGPLCLALPGASLARLAGMQAQLLHSINNRASLVKALQPSAGAGGTYHPGLTSHHTHLHTFSAPCSIADCRSSDGSVESNASGGKKECNDGNSCSNGGCVIANDNGGDYFASGGGGSNSDNGEEGNHNRCRANGCCADDGGGIGADDVGGVRGGDGGGNDSRDTSGSGGDDYGRADDSSIADDDIGGSVSRSCGRDDGGDGGIDVGGCGRGYDGAPGVVDETEGTPVLGYEISDAAALAGCEQVYGEVGIEPVHGTQNGNAIMEPRTGNTNCESRTPEQMGLLRHRKRGRLKTGTAAEYDSTGAWVNEGLAYVTTSDAFASPFYLRVAGGVVAFFLAAYIALVLAVAGASQTPGTFAAVAANRLGLDDGDRLGLSGGSQPGCDDCDRFGSSGGCYGLGYGSRTRLGSDGVDLFVCGSGNSVGWSNRLDFFDGDRLCLVGDCQLGCGGGSRLGWGASARYVCLGSDNGTRLGWSSGDGLKRDDRPGGDGGDRLGSGGGRRLRGSGDDRLGWSGRDRLVSGTTGYGGQLGRKGSDRLGRASASSNQLGSSGSDRLGCDGLGCGDYEGPRIGSRLSEGRLGYGVNSRKSENIGWIVGFRVAARKGSGLALLARIIFDKDNPADRPCKGDG